MAIQRQPRVCQRRHDVAVPKFVQSSLVSFFVQSLRQLIVPYRLQNKAKIRTVLTTCEFRTINEEIIIDNKGIIYNADICRYVDNLMLCI